MGDVVNLPPRRLTVELTGNAHLAIERRCEVEGFNKTTVINRAVQVYDLVTDAIDKGHVVLIDDGDALRRLVIL